MRLLRKRRKTVNARGPNGHRFLIKMFSKVTPRPSGLVFLCQDAESGSAKVNEYIITTTDIGCKARIPNLNTFLTSFTTELGYAGLVGVTLFVLILAT